MLKSSKLVFCLGKQRRTCFPPFLTENYDKLQIIKNTHWQIQVNPLITLFWTFRWWKIRSFLSHKVGEKMIFTDYGEVLVLNFSVMGNKVFFTAKKLMERWYLHGLFELSMIFQDLGNMVFCTVCWPRDWWTCWPSHWWTCWLSHYWACWLRDWWTCWLRYWWSRWLRRWWICWLRYWWACWPRH